MLQRLILFGASGDVASRYIFPALVRLRQDGHLPEKLSIVGVARQRWTDEQFHHHLRDGLASSKIKLDEAAVGAFLPAVSYRPADLTKADEVASAVGRSGEPALVYLAVPPSLFGPGIEALARTELVNGSRLILEKPFGESLQSARELNRLVQTHFPESAVFRIDHFLGKPTVQNVLGLRFANRIFEPLWSQHHIEQVRIVWEEREGLEGRAGYYDKVGALKDMVQNHLLQLLSLIAMERPPTMNEGDFRDQKVAVLRAVRSLSDDEVVQHTLRGRYAAGTAGDRDVPAYTQEEGVVPERNTETFAQTTLWINNARWSGVPFVLRTGKALARDRRQIVVQFHGVPHSPFAGQPHSRNEVRLDLDPDRVSLRVNANGPGNPLELEPLDLQATIVPDRIPAYGHLLNDALQGDPTFFVRADEAEESWRIVDPILRGWRQGAVGLAEYPAGSRGP